MMRIDEQTIDAMRAAAEAESAAMRRDPPDRGPGRPESRGLAGMAYDMLSTAARDGQVDTRRAAALAYGTKPNTWAKCAFDLVIRGFLVRSGLGVARITEAGRAQLRKSEGMQ